VPITKDAENAKTIMTKLRLRPKVEMARETLKVSRHTSDTAPKHRPFVPVEYSSVPTIEKVRTER